jgi:hypothetical protein
MWKEPEETLNLQVAVKHTRMTPKCLFSCFPARATPPIAVIHNSKIFRTGIQMTARHQKGQQGAETRTQRHIKLTPYNHKHVEEN